MYSLFEFFFFSRFDDAPTTSIDEGIHIMFPAGERMPPQELVLFCISGASITGLHYDPMVLRGSGRVSKSPSRARREERMKKDMLSSNASRKHQKKTTARLCGSA